MLRLVAGRNRALEGALCRDVARVLSGGGEATMVVPPQITLETELALMDALSLEGSFQMRVLSPERLCAMIFDAAGYPEGARVDDRGRAMLVSRAMKRLEEELTIYRGAQARQGFVARAARQVQIFRQAGLSPEDVRALAQQESGSLRAKLEDIAAILEGYEAVMEGRFEDGEGELVLAAQRAQDARFLRGAHFWFYGFDLMPPTLHELIAAVAQQAETAVLLPLEPNARARDADLFYPLRASAQRLASLARERGARVEWESAPAAAPESDDLAALSSELFSCPVRSSEAAPSHVQLFEARSVREEARFAAALIRRLVRARGWRYRDVRVLVPALDAYRQPLDEAFGAYQIPAFMAESRPCARRPLAECLLTALDAAARGAREEDLHACLAGGFLPVEPHEADRLRNYAVAYGLRAEMFFKPLTRGPAALIEALEPIRARAMGPIDALRSRLKQSRTLQAQLAAVYGFLEDIGAYEANLERQKALCASGLYEEAGEEAQAWNRLIGALDQMAQLLGEERLSAREIASRLRESLDAALVKPLPQSGDAVLVQGASRLSMRPVRAVLLLGQTERAALSQSALLTDRQIEAVSARAKRYLGLTPSDAARARLFYAKAGVEMATDYVCISYPLAGADGAAERPGPVVAQMRQALPKLRARGGVSGDEAVEQMLLEAPEAALSRVAAALRKGLTPCQAHALDTLARMDEPRAQLERLLTALDLRAASERLSANTARLLYDGLRKASVSRLEAFAACPFSHFMRYALKPVVIEPYALTPRDEGAFFHDAVRGFLGGVMRDGDADPERAQSRMDAVAEALLAPLREGPLGQSALSRAEERRLKNVARTAARLIAEQLADSDFQPVALEVRFGEEDGEASLRVGADGGCTLYGAIDRIDEWDAGNARYVRVLDYKRGSKPFSLAEAWAGLQLQLLVYLAAAAKKRGALGAGAFYFRMDDGYVLTQQTDPQAVAALRRDQLRMDGAALEDERAQQALSRQPKSFYRALAPMDRAQMDALLARSVEMASRHVDAIRAGEAAPAPVRVGKTIACGYCQWRGACMFDQNADRARVRRVAADKAAVKAALEGEHT